MIFSANNYGRSIKLFREIFDIKQKDLAKQIGITPLSLSKHEKGVGCPSISTLSSISSFFHVLYGDLAELIGNEEKYSLYELYIILNPSFPCSDIPKANISRIFKYIRIFKGISKRSVCYKSGVDTADPNKVCENTLLFLERLNHDPSLTTITLLSCLYDVNLTNVIAICEKTKNMSNSDAALIVAKELAKNSKLSDN